MKLPSILASSLVMIGAGSLQAAVIYDFSATEALNDRFYRSGVSEVAGWTQSVPNPTISSLEAPLAFIYTADFGLGVSGLAGYLGTLSANLSPNQNVALTGSLAGYATANQSLSLNIRLTSTNPAGFPTRDHFSIGVTGSSGSAPSVLITPKAGDLNYWVVTAGSGSVEIGANVGYLLTYEFKDASVFYYYGAANGSTKILIGSAAASIGAEFQSLAITHLPQGTAGTSSNAIIFDNISIVPEPSTALLVGVASLGLLRRRRA